MDPNQTKLSSVSLHLANPEEGFEEHTLCTSFLADQKKEHKDWSREDSKQWDIWKFARQTIFSYGEWPVPLPRNKSTAARLGVSDLMWDASTSDIKVANDLVSKEKDTIAQKYKSLKAALDLSINNVVNGMTVHIDDITVSLEALKLTPREAITGCFEVLDTYNRILSQISFGWSQGPIRESYNLMRQAYQYLTVQATMPLSVTKRDSTENQALQILQTEALELNAEAIWCNAVSLLREQALHCISNVLRVPESKFASGKDGVKEALWGPTLDPGLEEHNAELQKYFTRLQSKYAKDTKESAIARDSHQNELAVHCSQNSLDLGKIHELSLSSLSSFRPGLIPDTATPTRSKGDGEASQSLGESTLHPAGKEAGNSGTVSVVSKKAKRKKRAKGKIALKAEFEVSNQSGNFPSWADIVEEQIEEEGLFDPYTMLCKQSLYKSSMAKAKDPPTYEEATQSGQSRSRRETSGKKDCYIY